jgi:hypothetical protein
MPPREKQKKVNLKQIIQKIASKCIFEHFYYLQTPFQGNFVAIIKMYECGT